MYMEHRGPNNLLPNSNRIFQNSFIRPPSDMEPNNLIFLRWHSWWIAVKMFMYLAGEDGYLRGPIPMAYPGPWECLSRPTLLKRIPTEGIFILLSSSTTH